MKVCVGGTCGMVRAVGFAGAMVALWVGGVAVAAPPPPPPDPPAYEVKDGLEQAVLHFHEAWLTAWKKRDLPGLMRLWLSAALPDATFTLDQMDLPVTLDEWVDLWTLNLARGRVVGFPNWKLSEIQADGDTGVVKTSHLWRWSTLGPGQKSYLWERRTHATETWVRMKGRWRLSGVVDDLSTSDTTLVSPSRSQRQLVGGARKSLMPLSLQEGVAVFTPFYAKEAAFLNARDFDGLTRWYEETLDRDFVSRGFTPSAAAHERSAFPESVMGPFRRASQVNATTRVNHFRLMGNVAIVDNQFTASWTTPYPDGAVAGASMEATNRDLWSLTPRGWKWRSRVMINGTAKSSISQPAPPSEVPSDETG